MWGRDWFDTGPHLTSFLVTVVVADLQGWFGRVIAITRLEM